MGAALCGFALAGETEVNALTYGFDRITANGTYNVEDQFTLSLTSTLANQVSFRLENNGPLASVITSVYFDDASGPSAVLKEIDSLWGSSGVVFSLGASPGNMPGGNPIQFSATSGLTADANNPKPHKGIGPGEWLTMNVELNPSATFLDVAAAISNGDLRFGMHVQSLPDGASDSFVNFVTPFDSPEVITPVEDPVLVPDGGSAIAFLGFGFISLQILRKKLIKR